MAEEGGHHGGIQNGRCFAESANHTSPPLFHNGELNFQAHHVGWIVSGFFASVAVVTSFWLIDKHLVWYTNKAQQRQIVRLLLMVPIYAVVSLLSYIYWNHATAIVLARDCYESFVLYSFFYLLLLYLSDDPMEQREIFKHFKLEKWMWPMGWVKYRPEDGLYFLQLMKWGVMQYSVLRPLCTLASIGLNYVGLYCELSWSPGWGHIWLVTIISISVTISMYCLFQLYFAVKEELQPFKPLLKLFAIKAVVFLTFWQATFLSVLAMLGWVKDTKYMTAEDINIGIGAILETFEMMIFAFLHVKAFSYKPYKSEDGKRTPRMRGIRHAFWYRDMWKEFKDGCVYLWRRMRGKEAEKLMRKQIHLENAMGRSRRMHRGAGGAIQVQRPQPTAPKEGMPGDRPELPWLQVDDDGLGEEVGIELEKRGLGAGKKKAGRDSELDRDQELQDARAAGHSRQHGSWWRRAYDRVSGRASADERYSELPSPTSPGPKEKLKIKGTKASPRKQRWEEDEIDLDPLDEPPPPSIIFKNPNKSPYAKVAQDDVDEEGRRPRKRQMDYVPQRSQPIDFRPRASHHTDELSLLQRPSGAAEMSPSPPRVRAQPMPPELSRSPPQKHAKLGVPPPASVARSDSLLGRVFAQPAVDETALSHSEGGLLSRSMSMVSDPRQQMRESQQMRTVAAVLDTAPLAQSVAGHGADEVPPRPPSVKPTAPRPPSVKPSLPRPPSVQPSVPAPASPISHAPTPPVSLHPSEELAARSLETHLVDTPPPAPPKDSPRSQPGSLPESVPRDFGVAPPPHPPPREQRTQGAHRYSGPVGPPPRGPPRPKVVLPAPLSPARFPGPAQGEVRSFQAAAADTMQGPGRAYEPPRAAYPQRESRREPPPPQQDPRQYRQQQRDSRQYPPAEFSPSRQQGGTQRFPAPHEFDNDVRRADFSPVDRGRQPYRGHAPPPPPHHAVSPPRPPVLPGLDYLPQLPPAQPLSPPHAAMFPNSPVTSPERTPYSYDGSPSRVMRLPRDDVPYTQAGTARGRMSASVEGARDGPGPRHPQVQRMTGPRRTSLDPAVPFAPVNPGEVIRPLNSHQDRRRSAPVGYGAPPQPYAQPQYRGSPPRRDPYVAAYAQQGPYPPPPQQGPYPSTARPHRVLSDPYDARHRPPGAAAPHVSSTAAQNLEPISPMPIRPSPNHVRDLTPPTPDPVNGLVPYVPRSERGRNTGLDSVRAPWT